MKNNPVKRTFGFGMALVICVGLMGGCGKRNVVTAMPGSGYENGKWGNAPIRETRMEEVDPFVEMYANAHLHWDTEGKQKDGVAGIERAIDSKGSVVDVVYDVEEGQDVSNGDVLHLEVGEDTLELYAMNGWKPTRTSYDWTVDIMPKRITDEDVFSYIREEDLEKHERITSLIFQEHEYAPYIENRKVKVVGMLYCGREGESSDSLLFVYHVEDGNVPGGWYAAGIIAGGLRLYNADMGEHYIVGQPHDNWYLTTEESGTIGLDARSQLDLHGFEWEGYGYNGFRTPEELAAACEKWNPTEGHSNVQTWGICDDLFQATR